MLYKVLDEDGKPMHGGRGSWPLPVRNEDGTWTPGEWLRVEGPLVPCRHGLHLCREEDLLHWLGPVIYEAEHRGEMLELDDVVVVREARLLRRLDGWNERTARLFASDCAERVLTIYERACPGDRRPRTAIEVARRYADGVARGQELAVAEAAARAAARTAATWAATGAAEAATWTATEAAVRAAAEAAAWAVEAAVWVASRTAERQWQQRRLLAYLYNRLDEPEEA